MLNVNVTDFYNQARVIMRGIAYGFPMDATGVPIFDYTFLHAKRLLPQP
ncbi:hypothetical protein [Paenibacillus sp. MSJ-34]|nr:hypothetical protein [Paenibacillus sp. MSJ-34]MBU5442324.1 hypothetical protein [Paenibacillus sp. MSJ-34]CAH0119899.1 hypothetical protein PAE9249_02407 [Paenibacillus sp. CECT 9249]